MDHHAFRFIYDQQMIVLIDDVQRNILRRHIQFFRRRNPDENPVAGTQLIILGCLRPSLHGDPPLLDETLDIAAGGVLNLFCQIRIDPHPRCLLADFDFKRAFGFRLRILGRNPGKIPRSFRFRLRCFIFKNHAHAFSRL